MRKYLWLCAPFIFILSFSTCAKLWRKLWGDTDLGNNLSLLEGDRVEDRTIVYCTGRSAGTCFAGTYVIPTYARQFNSNGQYAEYVKDAIADKEWIIAKTVRITSKKEDYWIINKNFTLNDLHCDTASCDSIIQSHVFGPFKLIDFKSQIVRLKINLKFDEN